MSESTQPFRDSVEQVVESFSKSLRDHLLQPSGLIRRMHVEGLPEDGREKSASRAAASMGVLRARYQKVPEAEQLGTVMQYVFLSGYAFARDGKMDFALRSSLKSLDEGFMDLSAEQCQLLTSVLPELITGKFLDKSDEFQYRICWSVGKRMAKYVQDSNALEEIFRTEWVGDDV